MDQNSSSSETSDDDTDPEQSDQPSGIADMVQTVNGRGPQELLETKHPTGLLLTGTCLGLSIMIRLIYLMH